MSLQFEGVRRDRAVAAAGLAGVVLVAWLYLLNMTRDMRGMAMAAPMATPAPWGPGELLAAFAMWAVMMVAMMLPSAAPMILLYATVARRRAATGGPAAPTMVFAFAYVATWTVFSLLAALGQLGLQRAALLSPASLTAAPWFAAVLLVAAGLYELTPLKHACLARCQSPLGFIMTQWREGVRGALVMGARHGAYCVGCCWALMGILFVAGVMNLLWVAAIGGLILAQKLLPGRTVSWVAGVAFLAWGLLIAARVF